MYKCPDCGAALRFDPKTQMMQCDHCLKSLSPKSDVLTHFNQSAGQSAPGSFESSEDTYPSMVYTCPNCGGTLISTDETAVTFCSYCGSSVVLEGRLEAQATPDVIIPFQIGKEECKEAYKRLVKRAIFAPNYMKKDSEIEKFRGIYMPYWIYAFFASGETAGDGKRTYRVGDYVITDRYRINRHIEASYEGLSYDAASNFSDIMSQAIAPFRAAGAEPFTPSYMSGFYADLSDVDKEVYEADADEVAKEYMAEQTMDDPEYTRCHVDKTSVKNTIPMSAGNKIKGYFPVWFLANRTPDGKKVSYAVVNGETGRIAADLPIAFWKYILGSLLFAVPVFFLLNLFITVTPVNALIATVVMAVITVFVLNYRFNRTYEKQEDLSDKGLRYRREAEEAGRDSEISSLNEANNREAVRKEEKKNTRKGAALTVLWVVLGIVAFIIYSILGESDSEAGFGFIVVTVIATVIIYFLITLVKSIREKRRNNGSAAVKAPLKHKFKYLVKPLIGVAATIIILIIRPVQDYFYYGAAIITELLVILSVFDAVRLHNVGTTRPIPQFGKRGGTGNE